MTISEELLKPPVIGLLSTGLLMVMRTFRKRGSNDASIDGVELERRIKKVEALGGRLATVESECGDTAGRVTELERKLATHGYLESRIAGVESKCNDLSASNEHRRLENQESLWQIQRINQRLESAPGS